jgi:SAM-dependent methyltransferase
MFSESAQWYDEFYAAKDYEAETRRIATLLRERRPDAATLLDVGCGTGRHLEHLRAEFSCQGLDADAGLLAVAAVRLPDVVLHTGDMTDFALDDRFDAITCLFSAIGYVRTYANLRRATAAMARHLTRGGVLVVEPWVLPEAWIDPGEISVEVVDQAGGKLVRVILSARNGHTSSLHIHYVRATHDGITCADETHTLALFEKRDYLDSLAAAGLRPEWIDDGLTGRGLLVGVHR